MSEAWQRCRVQAGSPSPGSPPERGSRRLTLRARIAAVASASVALAVIAAALGTYFAVRSDLRGEVDRSLEGRAASLAHLVARQGAAQPPPAARPPRGAHPPPRLPRRKSGHGGPAGPSYPTRIPPAPLGAPTGYVQFVAPSGAVSVPAGQGSTRALPIDSAQRRIAAAGAGTQLRDLVISGKELRVLTVGLRKHGALVLARPLTEVNSELAGIVALLAIVGAAGVAFAALLGLLVARTALAPIARFTARAETVSGGLDLDERLHVEGDDELARLARSFNVTLDALQRSLQAQRQLVADASHELRTPIASLRANIEVLGEAGRLSEREQRELRADVVRELDELTALVADVVELARGAGGAGGPAAVEAEEVRLDQIVQEALARARRRAPALRFEVALEPAVVLGDPARIARAVANVIENARKWSEDDGVVEVRLKDGVLSVRDHGPGFEADDLPHVFDRFYRARSARGLPGSGLGLAIVRQAAEAHGGVAEAENAHGGGALVRVSFGAVVPTGEAGEAGDVLPPAAGGGDARAAGRTRLL